MDNQQSINDQIIMNLQVDYTLNLSGQDARLSAPLTESHLTLLDLRSRRTHEEDIIKPYPMNKSVCISQRISESTVNIDHTKLVSAVINNQAIPWFLNTRESTAIPQEAALLEKEPSLMHQFKKTIKLADLMIQTSALVDTSSEIEQYEQKPYLIDLDAAIQETFRYGEGTCLSTVDCDWSPESSTILATAVCPLPYNSNGTLNDTQSYIWSMDYPTKPYTILNPLTHLTTIEFNKQNQHQLIGGMTNGQISIFDIRLKTNAVLRTPSEHVRSIVGTAWIQSRTNQDFMSASEEGLVLWWDSRMLDKSTDQIDLSENYTNITCLDYEPSVPNRFTLSTIDGSILVCSRKAKTESERINHIWTSSIKTCIRSLKRNPKQAKCVLTTSNNNIKLWHDDFKEGRLLNIVCSSQALVSDWSPSKSSVLAVADSFNRLQLWDLVVQCDMPIASVYTGDRKMRSMKFNNKYGYLLALGTNRGSARVMRLKDDYVEPSNEHLFNVFLDRQTQIVKDKILDEHLMGQYDDCKLELIVKNAVSDEASSSSEIFTTSDTTNCVENITDDNIIKEAQEKLKEPIERVMNRWMRDVALEQYEERIAELDREKSFAQRRAKFLSRMDIMRRVTTKDQLFMKTLLAIKEDTTLKLEQKINEIQQEIDDITENVTVQEESTANETFKAELDEADEISQSIDWDGELDKNNEV